MRKAIAGAVLCVINVCVGFLVEAISQLGVITWLYVIIVCFLILIGLYFPEISAPWRKRKRISDMAMKTVIAHVLSQGAYVPYTPRSRAEMEAFCDIHKLACEGKIHIFSKSHSEPFPKQMT